MHDLGQSLRPSYIGGFHWLPTARYANLARSSLPNQMGSRPAFDIAAITDYSQRSHEAALPPVRIRKRGKFATRRPDFLSYSTIHACIQTDGWLGKSTGSLLNLLLFPILPIHPRLLVWQMAADGYLLPTLL